MPTKILKDPNGTEIKITGSHNWAEIQFDEEGDAFFMRHGEKMKLDEFMRLEPNGGPLANEGFHGADAWSAFHGDVIKISDCGDAVQCWSYVS